MVGFPPADGVRAVQLLVHDHARQLVRECQSGEAPRPLGGLQHGGGERVRAADRELGLVVREMAIAAALDDPRFAPVSLEEFPSLALEISVLSERTLLPAPVDADRVVVGRDGVIVRCEQHIALLLPQVAREYHWGPEAFLAAACRKAGLSPDAWREPGTEVFTFQADVFGEDE